MAAATSAIEVEPEIEASAVRYPWFAFLLEPPYLSLLDSMVKSQILHMTRKCMFGKSLYEGCIQLLIRCQARVIPRQ